jgi:hypothetical protein
MVWGGAGRARDDELFELWKRSLTPGGGMRWGSRRRGKAHAYTAVLFKICDILGEIVQSHLMYREGTLHECM